MATQVVDKAAMADIAASHGLSVISLISQADIIVKGVIILLLLASMWCWAIIFEKFRSLKIVDTRINKFEKIFWSGQLLEDLYQRMQKHADNPMSTVFVAAMQEWGRRKNPEEGAARSSVLRAGVKERIVQAMQVARNRSVDRLESNLTFLATVGSSAPFIGLFGTVWGIMNSFQSIAISKNTTLAVVAPGIAEALLATAIGLFAAIPAMIFYNKFSSDLNRLVGKIDDFSNELDALLSRELDS